MAVILQTKRLTFEPFEPTELDLLSSLHGDAAVQQYLGGKFSSEAVEENLRQQIFDQHEVGFSKWKVSLHSGEFVGKAGIQPFPRRGPQRGALNEIGYAFLPGYWGRGFATEAALSIAEWYFENTRYDDLDALVDPQNLVSQNVLRKLGMSFVEVRDVGLYTPHAIFRMHRTQIACP